jgi:hypothetical protein
MNRIGLAALIAIAFIRAQTNAHAGTCGEEVVKLRKGADETQVHRFSGPTEGQTVGAQLHHQPTPESIAAAENNAVDKVSAVLNRAQDFDTAGNEAECMASVKEAKLLLGLE